MTAPIVIAPLAELDAAVARWSPAHVVSIQSPPGTAPALGVAHHLSLTFHDVVDETPPLPDLVHPARDHAALLVELARAWTGERPLLIHCRFAVSRSPAAALIVAAARAPGADPRELVARLRRAAPHATPNRHLLAAADALLGHEGGVGLAAAARAAGRGASVATGTTVVLDLNRNDAWGEDGGASR